MTLYSKLVSSAWTRSMLLIVTVLAIYSPVLGGGFIWDDDTHLYNNLLVQPHGLYRSWLTTDQHNYWPVTWTALWFQWQWWGMNPFGYHVVTVLLHAGCALMLWRVLRQLDIPGAWISAMLFAVHPVNVETAAWITQQKNLLSMLFATITVLLYLRSMKEGRRELYAIALVTFMLSLLAKTMTVMIPCALVGCAWWVRRRLSLRDIASALPFFAMALAMSLAEIWFQYNRALAMDVRVDSPLARLVGSGHAILFYLSKIFLPLNLSFVYADRHFDPTAPVEYLPLLLVTAVALIVFFNKNTWGRPILFGLGYYVVTLLPVVGFLNIYFMRYSWVSDHWQYASIIGPIALVVGLLAHVCRTTLQAHARPMALCAGVAIVLLGQQSFERAAVFRDSETLWHDTLVNNPAAWMARNNLATDLLAAGHLDEAIDQLSLALETYPEGVNVRLNLAQAWATAGHPEKGVPFLKAALEFEPKNPDIFYELGRMYLLQLQDVTAADFFRQSLAIQPNSADTHVGLGIALLHLNQHEPASAEFHHALDVDPQNALARQMLDQARNAPPQN